MQIEALCYDCSRRWDTTMAFRMEMLQDDTVQDLVKSLHEMVGVANECPNLQEIDGTTNVIEEIDRTISASRNSY
jgi:hypothetical protein